MHNEMCMWVKYIGPILQNTISLIPPYENLFIKRLHCLRVKKWEECEICFKCATFSASQCKNIDRPIRYPRHPIPHPSHISCIIIDILDSTTLDPYCLQKQHGFSLNIHCDSHNVTMQVIYPEVKALKTEQVKLNEEIKWIITG